MYGKYIPESVWQIVQKSLHSLCMKLATTQQLVEISVSKIFFSEAVVHSCSLVYPFRNILQSASNEKVYHLKKCRLRAV